MPSKCNVHKVHVSNGNLTPQATVSYKKSHFQRANAKHRYSFDFGLDSKCPSMPSPSFLTDGYHVHLYESNIFTQAVFKWLGDAHLDQRVGGAQPAQARPCRCRTQDRLLRQPARVMAAPPCRPLLAILLVHLYCVWLNDFLVKTAYTL